MLLRTKRPTKYGMVSNESRALEPPHVKIWGIYMKLRYKSQFWSHFHGIHMVSAGPLMGEPYCFWKQSVQWNHIYGGKCAPKTGFSGLSQMVWGFLRKKLKNWIWYPIYKKKKKKVIFIFVVRPPVPSKVVTLPKINFCLYFGKYCFFRKSC